MTKEIEQKQTTEALIQSEIDISLAALEKKLIQETAEYPEHYLVTYPELPTSFYASMYAPIEQYVEDHPDEKHLLDDFKKNAGSPYNLIFLDVSMPILSSDIITDLEKATQLRRDEDGYLLISEKRDYETHEYNIDATIDYQKAVDGDNVYVKQIASALLSNAPDNYTYSKEEEANILLAFIHSLEYIYDPQGADRDDVSPPSFTLLRRGGDCEDLTILYASLLEARNIPYEIILGENEEGRHAFIAVAGDFEKFYDEWRDEAPVTIPAQLDSFEKDGVTYYYAETTSSAGFVGQKGKGTKVKAVLSECTKTLGEGKEEFKNELKQLSPSF